MSLTYGPIAGQLWQCLSTDTKPTDSRVQVNDLLYVTDTQAFFVFNGAWNQTTLVPPMRTRR